MAVITPTRRVVQSMACAPAARGTVFICYSRWDQAYANRLAAWLNTAAIPTWMSGTGCHDLAWWRSVLPRIDGCAAVVVLMTPRSRIAEGVAREIGYAYSVGRPVIPVLLEGDSFLHGNGLFETGMTDGRLPDGALVERLRSWPAASLQP